MCQLEKFIRNHAEAFDTVGVPDGDERRFLDRWDARSRTRRIVLPFAAVALAASLALFLLIRGTGTRDWLKGAEKTPEGIYSGYLAAVSSAWEILGSDEQAAEILSGLTEETVPLGDQLPEELSEEERTEILHDYYNTLLDGVEKIRKTIN